MLRRTFLGTPLAAAAPRPRSLMFNARGNSGFMNTEGRLARISADGTDFRILDFGKPNHAGWGPYCFFKDARRIVLLSIEYTADWKTKPFQEYYPKSKTHLWVYDIASGSLDEIRGKERLSNFYAPCVLLPGEDRIAVTAIIDGKSRLYTMDLDGRNARPITQPDEFVYGVSLSPGGKHFAFHAGYRINVTRIDGSGRIEIAGEKGMLAFGTSWSPDNEWILYQVCHPREDPAHDWSGIWIGRPDGSQNQPLTKGQASWFGASYGTAGNPGGGSNMPQWAPDGSAILYPRRTPDSKVPWEFQPNRPGTDHYNRDFKPEAARGGTQIVSIHPKTRQEIPLTIREEGRWDFRPVWSPDSAQILFARAHNGENPALWVMDRDGGNARFLTRGVSGQGVDHPHWLPA
jgi:TolB protein